MAKWFKGEGESTLNYHSIGYKNDHPCPLLEGREPCPYLA
jgi:hypothetical protein